jgi:hypothetical protein
MIRDRDARMIDRIALVAQMLCDIGDPRVPFKLKSRSVFSGMGDILLEVHTYLTRRFEMLQTSMDEASERLDSAPPKASPRPARQEEPPPADRFPEAPALDIRNDSADKQGKAENAKKGLWDD